MAIEPSWGCRVQVTATAFSAVSSDLVVRGDAGVLCFQSPDALPDLAEALVGAGAREPVAGSRTVLPEAGEDLRAAHEAAGVEHQSQGRSGQSLRFSFECPRLACGCAPASPSK